jgi:hypothetical protein
MVTLHAGRNDLEEAIMRIHGPTGIAFRVLETALLDDSLGDSSNAGLVTEEQQITLKEIQRGQIVSFSIPHSPPPAGGLLAASISVEYTVKGSGGEDSTVSPPLRRKFAAIRRISTALPLQVSVMDSFRGKM